MQIATGSLCKEMLTAARFGLVGLLATGIHVFVVWVLQFYTPLHPLLANAFAFLTAFGVSFSGHYVWTFQSPGNPRRAMRRFFLISACAFTINTLVLASLLHMEWLTPFFSTLVAIFVIPLITFLASRSWGFKVIKRSVTFMF
jgi:putative flippase GtrA